MMANGRKKNKKSKGSKVSGVQMDPVAEGAAAFAINKVVQMPEMVSLILQYLPTSDIKSCNGVNQLWHQEARKILLKRTRIEFIGPSIDTQILSYMNKMEKDCHHSVRIGKLYRLNRTSRARVMAVIEMFAKKYGSKILKLQAILGEPNILGLFPHVTALTVEWDGNVKIPADFKMEHVKTLCVKGTGKISLTPWPNIPVLQAPKIGSAKSLLQMCPVVDKLVLHNSFQHQFVMAFQQNDPTVPLPMISALKLVGRDGSIKEEGRPSKWLSRLPFPLTNLEIDVAVIVDRGGFLPNPSTALEEIFSKFSPTLKHLKLNHIMRNDLQTTQTSEVIFPIMPHLESLAITHHGFNVGYGPIQDLPNRKFVPLINFVFYARRGGNIKYAEQFPALKKLSIKPVFDATSYDPMDIHRNREATLAFSEMFFPEGALPCTTVTHVDIDCALYLLHHETCHCCHCSRVKRGNVWNMVKRMAKVFVNAMEVKNFKEPHIKSCTCTCSM